MIKYCKDNLYNVMTVLDPTIWEVGRYNSNRSSIVSERKD